MLVADFDYLSLATEHVTACNLCGGESFSVVTTRDRFDFPATAVTCNRCSLVFLNPRMSAESYAEFYRSGMYRSIVASKRGISREQQQAEMVYGQRVYARDASDVCAPYVGQHRGGTLLDIGGSNGIVAESLCKRFGLHGTVLEPSVSELAEAEQRGLSCIQGTIETLATDQQYDVVGIFQSIDHFLDIAWALQKVRKLLKPGGTFLVDIVEVRALLVACGPQKAIKIDHPFGLSDWTMRAYLARSGFRIHQVAVAREGARKIFYVCRAAEPVDWLPTSEAVAEMKALARIQ